MASGLCGGVRLDAAAPTGALFFAFFVTGSGRCRFGDGGGGVYAGGGGGAT
jgi:hypothetical protein